MTTVGFIGTGHLATSLVRGFDRAGGPYAIVVSPRNAAVADRLALDYGAVVAASNQEVADSSDVVIASVLPHQAELALASVKFRAGQLVVSVMAGIPFKRVAELARPARSVVAMMPGHANALGIGPSCLYPADAEATALLGYLGPVFPFNAEELFAVAAVFGGFSGMTFGWMAHIGRWFERHGLDTVTAHRLVAATLRGNSEVLFAEAGSPARIIEGVTTPGALPSLATRRSKRLAGMLAGTRS